MSELHDKARVLLALREKATPILGNCGCYNESDTTFRASGHDMADAIAALLAEVERLTAALADVKALAIKLDADRADLSVRAEAAEARLRELEALAQPEQRTKAEIDAIANAIIASIPDRSDDGAQTEQRGEDKHFGQFDEKARLPIQPEQRGEAGPCGKSPCPTGQVCKSPLCQAQPDGRDAGLQRAWAVAQEAAKPVLDFYAQHTAPPAPVVPDDVAKDAARYRWLKSWLVRHGLLVRETCRPAVEAPNGSYELFWPPYSIDRRNAPLGYGDTQDSAIDAAMLAAPEVPRG